MPISFDAYKERIDTLLRDLQERPATTHYALEASTREALITHLNRSSIFESKNHANYCFAYIAAVLQLMTDKGDASLRDFFRNTVNAISETDAESTSESTSSMKAAELKIFFDTLLSEIKHHRLTFTFTEQDTLLSTVHIKERGIDTTVSFPYLGIDRPSMKIAMIAGEYRPTAGEGHKLLAAKLINAATQIKDLVLRSAVLTYLMQSLFNDLRQRVTSLFGGGSVFAREMETPLNDLQTYAKKLDQEGLTDLLKEALKDESFTACINAGEIPQLIPVPATPAADTVAAVEGAAAGGGGAAGTSPGIREESENMLMIQFSHPDTQEPSRTFAFQKEHRVSFRKA